MKEKVNHGMPAELLARRIREEMSRTETAMRGERAAKIDLARQHITPLKKVLEWFFFEATADARMIFRGDLGEEWEDFIVLTRALAGEAAYQVVKYEGGLDRIRPSHPPVGRRRR